MLDPTFQNVGSNMLQPFVQPIQLVGSNNNVSPVARNLRVNVNRKLKQRIVLENLVDVVRAEDVYIVNKPLNNEKEKINVNMLNVVY